MKYLTTLSFFLFTSILFAQTDYHVKRYAHFEETRGNADTDLILTLPEQEIVQLHNSLNATSGLGTTFNYYGTIIVVDQMDILRDGTKQLILRREDGKDFFGYRPTLKAIIKNVVNDEDLADSSTSK